jgi:hypothetical protein
MNAGKEGKCYELEDGTYLGKFIKTSPGQAYGSDGPFGNYVRPIFNFENNDITDEDTKVKEVPCRTGGKRRTRKHKRKHKKTQKRRR